MAVPLVLVHGNPESAGVWGPLIAALDRDDAVSLSPPGFGVPASSGFSPTVEGYRQWLVERLEQFREPVDLVGHDWGGAHVARIAMTRPDLIRSWASDALGLFAPDYVWHKRAQVWQQEGAGEASVKELYGGTLAQRLEVVRSLGMTGPGAERVAAGMDDGMGRAVLSLLRSAAQPAMADLGRGLAKARQRPGLAVIALADVDQASGTPAQHRTAAEAAGAEIAELADVGHWWPVTDPHPVARALTAFWSRLDG
ncbi:alpha/beta hydrolase [Amycolatopsis sacchari]|uniref:Pimeloyl-ACP methyl ester carboxylesterase n=1 Tax=Amycolatopsis sacchari TaxID=115433 RepID=A0A1I3UQ91_9PSEU|nr:alpha/beta hydrolase [Amycolatopsis sacchari]SFJ84176.1 Pimeloyl-ACP methyl ester carboxylesterase [Amycolatopsis sacchari]